MPDLADRFDESARLWAARIGKDQNVPPEWFVPTSLDAAISESDFFTEKADDGVYQEVGRRAYRLLTASTMAAIHIQLSMLLHAAESPIEAAMGLALLVVARGEEIESVGLRVSGEEWGDDPLTDPPHERHGRRALIIEPQAQLGDHRVDFLLTFEGRVRREKTLQVATKQMVIECQGHDFHERTREQVSKDYERSRTLQSFGFLWFPFSGSDVWKDVFAHAEGAIAILGENVGDQLFPVGAG